MNTFYLKDFDIKNTLLGGQAFNWDFIDDFYYGFFTDKIVKLKYQNNFLYWQTYPKQNDFKFIKSYFRLDIDYNCILKKMSKDIWIKKAIKSFFGLRLLKQDFDSTLISFLLSSNNSITNIRKSIRLICRSVNKKIIIDNKAFYFFPTLEDIAKISISKLKKAKCGFRAQYIHLAAKNLIKNNLKKEIYFLVEDDVRNKLKEIKGIGDKIADCIMVFSLDYDNIVPLDTWCKKIFIKLYKLDKNMKYDDMRNWIKKYFSGYGSYAGQFLYEWSRRNKHLFY